jgi:AraC family transcriptional activator FtrA
MFLIDVHAREAASNHIASVKLKARMRCVACPAGGRQTCRGRLDWIAPLDPCHPSAGSAAGIDLMLHIIRHDVGVAAANAVARRLVMPPHRNGGQAQFIERPVPAAQAGKLSALLDAIRAKPALAWTVDDMARRAAMSPRTLIRRFAQTTGLPPGEWVTRLRVEEARRLLEATALPVEDVALRAGFGSVETMRHHFRHQVGLSPRDYRDTFG